MAWSGGTFIRTNGVYTGSQVWQNDLSANIKIVASRHDTHDLDLANGINACLHKGGQNSATANISMGGFKFTNVADGSAATDTASYGQTITAATYNTATKLLTLTRASGDITVTLTPYVGVSEINATGTPSATTFLRGDGSWATPAGGGGSSTASNLGAGEGVFQSKVGDDLQFNSLKAGVGISLSKAGGEITITNTGGGGGGGGGTVTSVDISNATGITFTGGPIVSSGSFTPALSANLQAWHALAPSSKADINSPTFTGTPAAPTPSSSDNSTKLATTAYVKAQGYGTGTVTGVALSGGTTGLSVTGSPITGSGTFTLAGTLAVANGGTGAIDATTARTNLGALAASAYTANDILAKLKTVDGAASGLDADLLDGQHASYFAPAASPTLTGTPAILNADGTGTTRIPRTFVQSGDPGADSADGDLWIW